MARPSIGIFGALFAVGSVLAWKWMQSQDAAHRRSSRDLNRWESEGGSVISSRGRRAGRNGEEVIGGTPDAWHFPRS